MSDKKILIEQLRRAASASSVMPDTLAALAADFFVFCGMTQEDAAIGAEVAVWAQLHGSDLHGAIDLPLYVRGLLDQTIKAKSILRHHSAHAVLCRYRRPSLPGLSCKPPGN